ncbi:CobW family GTP-binding protein [Brevibacterium album]|uniref:CobW family GTP-binding protein n=1 Tax=Brevibacterium album TaxID=417948 RepID=UPI0005530A7C|nr:CobW family GTP-binding protein [Brevibacterium album]
MPQAGRSARPGAVPVILLTGFLGAGKTSLLNHLLRHPDSRVGVVVNDFGDLNVDAGLVAGQVSEPVSISGGCICCLSDTSALEEALVSLAEPRLALDAIIVESSGFAEPLTLARMVSRWGRHRFHLAGVVDVVDALMHASTVDTGEAAPVRYAATTLVVVNKLDQLPEGEREGAVETVRARVHSRNPRALVTGTSFGRLDPLLLMDPGSRSSAEAAAGDEPISGQGVLPVWDLLREAHAERDRAALAALDESALPHRHAMSVTVTSPGCADPGAVLDLLEDLPQGVYRVKGALTVRERGRPRSYGVQAVGPTVYVSPASSAAAGSGEEEPESVLVVIGESFDASAVRAQLEAAFASAPADGRGIERLHRYVSLHS